MMTPLYSLTMAQERRDWTRKHYLTLISEADEQIKSSLPANATHTITSVFTNSKWRIAVEIMYDQDPEKHIVFMWENESINTAIINCTNQVYDYLGAKEDAAARRN